MSDDIKDKIDLIAEESITKISKSENLNELEDLRILYLGKKGLITSFLKTMREAAVDCELFKEHNKLLEDVRCFQFNKDDIIAPFVGPAYIEDIDQDEMIKKMQRNILRKLEW